MIYGLAIIAVMALGILSRQFPAWLPAALGKYPGDALWALMVFCSVGFLRPGATTMFAVAAALGFSCAFEFAKLYQAAWIESVRATLPGQLILGRVFSGNNLAAYALGIFTGGLVELGFHQWRAKRK